LSEILRNCVKYILPKILFRWTNFTFTHMAWQTLQYCIKDIRSKKHKIIVVEKIMIQYLNHYFLITIIFLQQLFFDHNYFSTTIIFQQHLFFYHNYFSTTIIFQQQLFFYNNYFFTTIIFYEQLFFTLQKNNDSTIWIIGYIKPVCKRGFHWPRRKTTTECLLTRTV